MLSRDLVQELFLASNISILSVSPLALFPPANKAVFPKPIAAASVGDLILFAGGRGLSSNSFDVVDIYNAKVFFCPIFSQFSTFLPVYRTTLGQQLLLPTKDMG